MDTSKNIFNPRSSVGFAPKSRSSLMASPNSPARRATAAQLSARRRFEPADRPVHATPSANRNAAAAKSMATPRNVFRASLSADTSNTAFTFSPRVPPSTMKKSFPPATPNTSKVLRTSATPMGGRGMAKTGSTELFSTNIPSPSADLTGEVLAKKVPEGTDRFGSIYAEEYCADLVPPGFDDLQRRQFFCILDLRRLKYMANEIFLKKDWKLNILNFAKEYERSRSMIMLRYGLYEFRSVKPSEEVMKKWRADNGVPDPEEETIEHAAKVNGTPGGITRPSKRKADEDLPPKDTALTAASPNKNKRRAMEKEPAGEVASPAVARSKRKVMVEDEDDENRSRKMPKSTPSSTRSLFERVANDVKTGASPLKQDSTAALSASTTTSKPNPFAQAVQKAANTSKPRGNGSVFDGVKPGSGLAPAPSNIFAHLSDQENSIKGGDADGEESESEGQEPASDSQEVEQSDGPSVAVSAEGPAPSQSGSALFASSKPGLFTAPSSTSSEQGNASDRSLFNRVTKAQDGQPVRVGTPAEEEASATADKESTPAPVAPGNNTWNPDTPILFSKTTNTLPSAASSTPSNSLFGPAPTPKAANAGSSVQTTEKASDDAKEASDKSKPSNLFANSFSANQTPGLSGSSALFGSTTPASNLFGAGTPAFGQPKPSDPPKPASTVFGVPKTDETPKADGKNVFQSNTLFGNANKSSDASATPSQPASVFGAPPKAEGAGLFGASSSASSGTNVFGKTDTTATPLFGSSTTSKPAESDSKPAFGASTNTGTGLFNFGATSSAPSAGADKPGKPVFGGLSASSSSEQKPLFGATAPAQNNSANSTFAFGNPTPSTTPALNFGASQNAGSSNAQVPAGSTPFGGQASTQNSSSMPFAFSGSGADQGANNPFGGQSSTPSFNFTGASTDNPANQANQGGSGFTFTFGAGGSSSAAPSAPASQNGNMFGGGSNAATPNFSFSAAPQGSPSPMFGPSNPSGISGGGTIFGNVNLGGTSTGTNTPFTFGGASSLATTPIAGTPEPGTTEREEPKVEEGEAPQEQIKLTEGGAGEESETVVHEVRAKALKYGNIKEDEEEEEKSREDKNKKSSPWNVAGVGPLRILKHKETGSVRMLMRAEPRGNVVLNKALIPTYEYKTVQGGKYVQLIASSDKGSGLETWMLQVKTKEVAQALTDALNTNKGTEKQ